MRRKPRNLHEYISAETAAKDMETLAARLREARTDYPLVRWTIHFDFWNPAWEGTRREGVLTPKRKESA